MFDCLPLIRYVYQNRLGQFAIFQLLVKQRKIVWDFGNMYDDDHWSYVCEL